MTSETYEQFRTRMQSEDPDPDRCEHAMPLAVRCIRCDDARFFAEHVKIIVVPMPREATR
jgi:hypothetical protein